MAISINGGGGGRRGRGGASLSEINVTPFVDVVLVLLRPIGDVVYFMPPYIVDEGEIDLMIQVAAEGIELATCD